MSVTSIEWTDFTWNPVYGCSMAKGSETGGCLNCYAALMAARNLPGMRSPTTGEPFARRTPNGPRWTGRVELIPSKLDEPLHWRKPRRVFVNSMSDLFHEALPDEAIEKVFAVMALAPKHTFQILTKRPARMREWFASGVPGLETREEDVQRAAEWRGKVVFDSRGSDRHRYPPRAGDVSNRLVWPGWPLPNVLLGVSVENRATLSRIYDLQATPAAKRFISVEPLLEQIDFTDGPADPGHSTMGEWSLLDGIDWVIIGGESGPGARPFDLAWARSTIRQCREAGVACFIKQLGSVWAGNQWKKTGEKWDRKGGDPSEWPEDLRVREFPAVSA